MVQVTRSLSSKLLLLAIAYVMLSEVLIFAPSIARFRVAYLMDRLEAAHTAALVVQGVSADTLEDGLMPELLRHAKAESIVLQQQDRRTLMLLLAEEPVMPSEFVDLRTARPIGNIVDAIAVYLRPEPRTIRVIGYSPVDESIQVEVVLSEAPLREAMIGFGWRILGLSIIISLTVAALIYVTLQGLMVRPMRRLTQSMIHFREDPEDADRVIVPQRRSDEIGVAETVLAEMQVGLRDALKQKERLAALGTAVGKINHDLRNALATAQLITDGLAASEDPQVRKVSPRLISAIDRAVNICSQTLDFAREGAPVLHPEAFAFSDLVEEVWATLDAARPADSALQVDGGVELYADRDQMFRVYNNLLRNAFEAGARRITLTAKAHDHGLLLTIADDGRGIPDAARDRLFEPFSGSAKVGGSGLGLSIAREIVVAHGGAIELADTGEQGSVFRIALPASALASSTVNTNLSDEADRRAAQ